ncbi:hypothetical protein CF15_07860 [Pyrodictium occultum]|uniref:Uncharacterized protein n=1 Tax=Pyrodictium occultum TaxID=2309 RepID=A0A0V8RRD8_PYROC|nr:hypothetical protein [Pyrodictium occultum]KSW10694.1 hypothetical protein CF15_07860 [Pyrodictium occultum]
MICLDRVLVLVGRLARSRGPPVVAASSIGSWYWCSLKAWHATSLFNAGWLSPGDLAEEAWRGLAILWSAELAKDSFAGIIRGRLLHGEDLEEVAREALGGAVLAKRLARGGAGEMQRLHREGSSRSWGS